MRHDDRSNLHRIGSNESTVYLYINISVYFNKMHIEIFFNPVISKPIDKSALYVSIYVDITRVANFFDSHF